MTIPKGVPGGIVALRDTGSGNGGDGVGCAGGSWGLF